MDNKAFRQELIKGIVEVSQNTGLTVNQCVYEAKKILEQKIKERYAKQFEKKLFKEW